MRFDKMAMTILALGLSFTHGVLAQSARESETASAVLPCGGTHPANRSIPASTKFQDTVIVNVRINKLGIVYDTKVVSGPPELTAAAIYAAKHWKHKPPYWLNGSSPERQTTLFVTLVKHAAPQIKEGTPGGVSGCLLAPTRVRISQTVMENRLLSRVKPVYPAQAQVDRIEGIVLMRVGVDKTGTVTAADIVSGPAVLGRAAIEAVKQWRYDPYLINGDPIDVDTTVAISFTL